MKTYGCSLRQLRLVILLCQLGLIVMGEAQKTESCIGHDTYRPPDQNDISVVCGTEYINVSILLCPLYEALYSDSQIVPNGQFHRPECFGTADWTVDPPVIKFGFALIDSSILFCNNTIKIIDTVGTGQFSDFSNVQSINISGVINSVDPSALMITYRPQIMYKFSCLYPMQYLLNNTELAVSGVNLAIRDNNGTFISTLHMSLYADEDHRVILYMPEEGLNLKTRIYVAVEATNLSDSFNVLLDSCYATTSLHPKQNDNFYLFAGCTRAARTKVEHNGASQTAYFSFETFRFMKHKNREISTFYLHCVTRLCEVSSCSRLQPNCSSSVRSFHFHHDPPGSKIISSHLIRVGSHHSSTTHSTTLHTSDAQMKEHVYKEEEPHYSIFDVSAGSISLSKSFYRIPLMAVIVCNVIIIMCFYV